MVFTKRSLFIIIGLLLAIAVSACGTTTSTGSTSSTPVATTAPAPTTAPAALIKTATLTVDGKSATALTDAQGKTLYYFTPDTATTTACTGTCAQNWPPLLATGSSAPTSDSTLTGTLTTLTTANGSQVLYNGHMLYTFAGDTTAGQVNGEGKAGKWFVATSDLTTGNPTTTGSTAGTVVIKTASTTVAGKTETILTTSDGMSLYYFTPDTATTSACTGACATSWPPLLFSGSGNPGASTKLTGELGVSKNANGSQVVYNSHPLYTFKGDTAAGQITGQGVGGKWFLATPDLAKNK